MALITLKSTGKSVGACPANLLDGFFEEEGAPVRSECNIILVDTEKNDFLEVINAERDRRIDGGIEFPPKSGQIFDSDETSQKNINGVVTMFMVAQGQGQADSFSQEWIKQDDTTVVLSGPEMVGLGVAVGKQVSLHRIHARGFKDQVRTAETLEDVLAVVDAYKAEMPEAPA